MSDTSLHVEKQFSLCGLGLRAAVFLCTLTQLIFCAVTGICLNQFLESTTIVYILLFIHITCALMALVFFVFCLIQRKFGTTYEVILHAYLLSILLMALTSFFGVMYLPLSFLQQTHSISEGVHYAFLLAAASGLLALQFIQRNLVEQMLPIMEHSFR
ncbi:unnamed protein product [Auanema sp. JU1783]|nr:unnamed protein product [Auanema sp. JU1783]